MDNMNKISLKSVDKPTYLLYNKTMKIHSNDAKENYREQENH